MYRKVRKKYRNGQKLYGNGQKMYGNVWEFRKLAALLIEILEPPSREEKSAVDGAEF
jgi:hypothetical protein